MTALTISFCGWSGATVRTAWQVSDPRLVVSGAPSDEEEMRVSLRKDIARHPWDFVSFPTQTAAMRFMRDHSMETSRETQPRLLDLGVVGYWQGRTLVVLPITPAVDR